MNNNYYMAYLALISAAVLSNGLNFLPNVNEQCKILLNDKNALYCQSYAASLCERLHCLRSSNDTQCIQMDFGAADGTPCGSGSVTGNFFF